MGAMRWTTTLALIFVLASGGVLAWFFIQDQPSQMLGASMKQLAASRVITGVGSMYWQHAVSGGQGQVFDGWISFNGVIDSRSSKKLQLSGVAGYDATQHAEDFQSADIATDDARIAVRPRVVSEALAPFLDPPPGSPTGTWITYQRDELLKHEGIEWAIASGTMQMISTTLSASHPELWLSIVSSEKGVDEKGHDIVRVKVRPNANRVSKVLFDVLSAWKGKALNAADLENAQRIARGMEMGTWTLDVDRMTHHLRAINGSWPMLDERGSVAGRISMQFSITHMGNSGGASTISKDAIDVTERIRPQANGGFDRPSERATSTAPLPEEVTSSTFKFRFPSNMSATSSATTTVK